MSTLEASKNLRSAAALIAVSNGDFHNARFRCRGLPSSRPAAAGSPCDATSVLHGTDGCTSYPPCAAALGVSHEVLNIPGPSFFVRSRKGRSSSRCL
jgi:hypothetical protein